MKEANASSGFLPAKRYHQAGDYLGQLQNPGTA